jgi:protein-tyrosine phosphatase
MTLIRERLLSLQGGRNFRDLGGYVTGDGRLLRWHKVYRSGTLAYLTPDDIARLEARKIHTIFDLRALEEREEERHPELGEVRQLVWNYDARRLFDSIRVADPSSTSMRQAMLDFYKRLPWLFAPQFKALFMLIAGGALPIVINCSAGKDRTGMASALLLSVLGVPRTTVLEDYALSDQLTDFEGGLVVPNLAKRTTAIGGFHGLDRLSAELRAPLLRSDPQYLATAFAEIDVRHGSVDAYMSAELGVNEDAINAIRSHLLESAYEGA